MRVLLCLILALMSSPHAYAGKVGAKMCEAAAAKEPITDELVKLYADLLTIEAAQEKSAALKEYLFKLDQMTQIYGDEFRAEILARISNVEIKKEKTVQERAQEQLIGMFTKMNFHPIPAGKFKMGPRGNQVSVTLTHPFEVMTTHVTQKMWAEVFEQVTAEFEPGEEGVVGVEINGQTIWMKPNHPAYDVSWYAVLEFANRISVRHGLKPVYDLSQFHRHSGSAGKGDLDGSGRIDINAPDGDYYQAEGYRIMTDAEYEYLLRNLGASNTKYPHGIKASETFDYGWRARDLEGKLETQPVATTRKSFVINGAEIHDLIGNVSEWTWDGYVADVPGGVDPVVDPNFREQAVMRGESWHGHGIGDSVMAHSRDGVRKNYHRSTGVSFRLVRTLFEK